MSTVIDTQSAIDPWSIDALLERYVYWREACVAVDEAYRCWAGSERSERGLAYGGYLAALDREEHAAVAYADQVEYVRAMFT
jgi:hypothetical protein